MSVPKPTVPLGIRHAHGHDYRAFGGIGLGVLLPEKLGNFTKSKDYLHIPQDLQGGQNGAFRRAEGGTPE